MAHWFLKSWTGEEDEGMNLEIMKAYLPLYRKAMVLTLKIGWMGIALAILIGLKNLVLYDT